MKLLCTNTHGRRPSLLEVGTEYDVTPLFGKDSWGVNGEYVQLSNFETPLQRLTRLIPLTSKVVIPSKSKGYTVDLLQTEKLLVIYSHSRGNHYNIFGNHYYYIHDVTTGEFMNTCNGLTRGIEIKQTLLKGDLELLQTIFAKTRNLVKPT